MNAWLLFASVLFTLLASLGLTAGTNPEGEKFLQENAKKDGVIVLPSGLQYKVLREGSGTDHPTKDSPCECHYAGTLIDGTSFDSSYDRGSPTTFAPNQVIAGWTEAMQMMVEGDKWEMYIPSDLAYGERGSPPKIQGGDALVFQMEIIKINGDKIPAVKCNPVTKDKCNEKEVAYIDKVQEKYGGNDDDATSKLTKEADRLRKMQGDKMKPELQQWLSRRLQILTKLIGDDDKEGEL